MSKGEVDVWRDTKGYLFVTWCDAKEGVKFYCWNHPNPNPVVG